MSKPVAFMATLATGDRWLSFEPIPVSDLRALPAEVRSLVVLHPDARTRVMDAIETFLATRTTAWFRSRKNNWDDVADPDFREVEVALMPVSYDGQIQLDELADEILAALEAP